MIDPRRLRDTSELDRLVAELARKRVPEADVRAAARADDAWRAAVGTADVLRQRKNEGSKAIGRAAPSDRPRIIAEMDSVASELAAAEATLATAEEAAREALIRLPNPPLAKVPDGGEDDFAVVRVVGDADDLPPQAIAFPAAADRFGLWDTKRAAKASGARFAYLTGAGALLEQALVRLAIETVTAHGYQLTIPPVLVREAAMVGTGFFPADRNEYYEVDGGALFLVGTSEVALAALHMDEILDAAPVRYAGLSSCFRREAGSYGKDTAGIFRVHQFTKVEMFSFVVPDDAEAEHERILAVEEEIVRALELPYRVIDIAAGDLGASAVRKFDVEAWLPSENRYREITSCSNCTDFQARRLKVRIRDAGFANTLNGTAVTDRWLCFIAEHYQQADGTLAVPDALRPFMVGGQSVIEPVSSGSGAIPLR